MTNIDPTFKKQVLDIPQQQRASTIEQNRHADHLGRRIETAERIDELAQFSVFSAPYLEGNFRLTRPFRNIALNHEMDTGGVSIPSKVTTAIITTIEANSATKLVLSISNECL